MEWSSFCSRRPNPNVKNAADLATRLATGDIEYDTLHPYLQATLGGKERHWAWDAWGAPVLHNLFGRSLKADGQKVYPERDIDSMFERASKGSLGELEMERDRNGAKGVEAQQKGNVLDGSGDKTKGNGEHPSPTGIADEKSVVNNYRNIKDDSWKNWAHLAGAGALGAGLAILLYFLFRKKGKKGADRRLTKRADMESGWKGWTARRIPEISLIDDMMRARTKEDYKSFNDGFYDMIEKNLHEHVPSEHAPSEGGSIGWSAPFSFPGDDVHLLKNLAPTIYGASAVNAQFAQPRNPKTWRHGIKPDSRISPLVALATLMLPTSENPHHRYSNYPNIGNLAYSFPQMMGQYASSKGLTDEQMRSLSTNGLDRVVIDAIKANAAEYPAVKNFLSAYINGGFGDISDPKGFGLRRPFWDYRAKAPTPEGTNMLKKTVHDIGAAGGYTDRGIDDYFIPYIFGSADAQDKFYRVALPDLISGNAPQKYRDVAINEKSKYWNETVKELESDPEMMKSVIKALDLPEDSDSRWVAYNLMHGVVNDRGSRFPGLMADWQFTKKYKDRLPKSIPKYRDALYDAFRRMHRERLDARKKIRIMPGESYIGKPGYDQGMADKHYNELLRFFDSVGPDLFMPRTVLGREAIYHPVGGLIPNIEKGWKRYIPYITRNEKIIKEIDDATGGGLSRALEKSEDLIREKREK